MGRMTSRRGRPRPLKRPFHNSIHCPQRRGGQSRGSRSRAGSVAPANRCARSIPTSRYGNQVVAADCSRGIQHPGSLWLGSFDDGHGYRRRANRLVGFDLYCWVYSTEYTYIGQNRQEVRGGLIGPSQAGGWSEERSARIRDPALHGSRSLETYVSIVRRHHAPALRRLLSGGGLCTSLQAVLDSVLQRCKSLRRATKGMALAAIGLAGASESQRWEL